MTSAALPLRPLLLLLLPTMQQQQIDCLTLSWCFSVLHCTRIGPRYFCTLPSNESVGPPLCRAVSFQSYFCLLPHNILHCNEMGVLFAQITIKTSSFVHSFALSVPFSMYTSLFLYQTHRIKTTRAKSGRKRIICRTMTAPESYNKTKTFSQRAFVYIVRGRANTSVHL